MPVFPSIAAAAHHQTHITLALRHDSRRRVPDPDLSSTSFMQVGHARPESGPTDRQVAAWDHNAGQADYQLENRAAVAELLAQLRRGFALLPDFCLGGELYARAIDDICVRGRSRFEAEHGWRHIGPAEERFMMLHGILDKRTLHKWLEIGWGFVGLVVVPAKAIEDAIKARAEVNFDALDWLRERGAL